MGDGPGQKTQDLLERGWSQVTGLGDLSENQALALEGPQHLSPTWLSSSSARPGLPAGWWKEPKVTAPTTSAPACFWALWPWPSLSRSPGPGPSQPYSLLQVPPGATCHPLARMFDPQWEKASASRSGGTWVGWGICLRPWSWAPPGSDLRWRRTSTGPEAAACWPQQAAKQT